MKKLSSLFGLCLHADYLHIDDVSYCALRTGGALTLLFQHSNGERDWQRNLDFAAVPYPPEAPLFRVHGGFFDAWKRVQTIIDDIIRDEAIRRVTVAGYSHGGALALLCHEYILRNRPDLAEYINSVSYGAPRVVAAGISDELALRWARLIVVRNEGDIVTQMPPRILGFAHVGQPLLIGQAGKYGPFEAHRAESYLTELELLGL